MPIDPGRNGQWIPSRGGNGCRRFNRCTSAVLAPGVANLHRGLLFILSRRKKCEHHTHDRERDRQRQWRRRRNHSRGSELVHRKTRRPLTDPTDPFDLQPATPGQSPTRMETSVDWAGGRRKIKYGAALLATTKSKSSLPGRQLGSSHVVSVYRLPTHDKRLAGWRPTARRSQ